MPRPLHCLSAAVTAAAVLFLAALVFQPAPLARAADQPDGDAAADTDPQAGEEREKADKADATFEVYKDRSGQFRWRLRLTNRQVIASSGEGYKDKRDCLKAVEAVKRVAADAPVSEEPADKAPKAGQ